mmetsp:Transcript_655/g.640  ORF Transcript_655/g.640 Transcript_655/m.640 type:complete len:232 (+) Transcript_655:2910-3605(+)
MEIVISMYNCEIGLPPTNDKVTGSFAYGAHIKMDETYWEEIVAANSILPPFMPLPASIFKGNEPSLFKYSIDEPFDLNASTSGPIGLSCILALPVKITCLSEEDWLTPTKEATVVKNLDAVPAFPKYNSCSHVIILPPLPVKTIVSPLSSVVISAPFKRDTASNICLVSSECKRFLILTVPEPKAAKTNALFEIDFEPGGMIVLLLGTRSASNGCTNTSSVKTNFNSSFDI